MKGTLYLNYWSKFNMIQCEHKFSVSLSEPEMREKVERLEGLVPSKLERNKLKYEGGTWEGFRNEYLNKIGGTSGMRSISRIKDLLDSGEDVCIYCWEKYMPCHRFIIGELFFGLGYRVRSFDGISFEDYIPGLCYYERGVLDMPRDIQENAQKLADERNKEYEE